MEFSSLQATAGLALLGKMSLGKGSEELAEVPCSAPVSKSSFARGRKSQAFSDPPHMSRIFSGTFLLIEDVTCVLEHCPNLTLRSKAGNFGFRALLYWEAREFRTKSTEGG